MSLVQQDFQNAGGSEKGGLPGRRYGYSNVQQLTRVVQSYEYFKIPLETFVTDSQYMDHDQDFTISPDFEPFGVSGFHSYQRLDAYCACHACSLRYTSMLSMPRQGCNEITKVCERCTHVSGTACVHA